MEGLEYLVEDLLLRHNASNIRPREIISASKER